MYDSPFKATIGLIFTILLLLTSCDYAPIISPPPEFPTPATRISPTIPESQEISSTPTKVPSQSDSQVYYGLTYHRLDGNRIIAGKGSLPDVSPIDIPLSGTPNWVVAAPFGDGSIWLTTLENGQVLAFQVTDRNVNEINISPPNLAPGQPPLLSVIDDVPSLLTFSSLDPSVLSHPVPLPGSGNFALINSSGDLVITDVSSIQVETLPVNALPDARILVDDQDRILLLTHPTMIYDHGVLGDEFEAASVTLIETIPTPEIIQTIHLPEGQVVEGIAPIWTDMDLDGDREIILTVSDLNQGAQIVVYKESGERLADGPAIGQAFRWRHQIVVGNFGPNEKIEFVDVLTPHIGGIIEYYQLLNNKLSIVAQLRGFTSHVIGSRNLDMAIAGDFDGDERVDLLLPNQALTELGAIYRTSTGVEVAWTLPIDGQMGTNLAAINLPGVGIAVGLGRQDQILRLWIP